MNSFGINAAMRNTSKRVPQ